MGVDLGHSNILLWKGLIASLFYLHYVCAKIIAALRYLILIIISLYVSSASAQTLTVSGTVSAGGAVQGDALIDVYEYNSAIQTLHTDDKGYFTFQMNKGKEYLVVIYKPGYILQSYSLSDNVQNPVANYSMTVSLSPDEHSPDGLYFKEPLKRIAPQVDYKSFIESKFQLDQVKPKHRADSVLVLLNRAQANQYILVAKMKLGTDKVDEKYSRQVAANIKAEMSSYATQMVQSNSRYDSIKQLEDAHVAASLTAKDDEQFGHLVLAQKNLAERLAERSNYFLLLQQKQLAKARLLELEAIRNEQLMAAATDSTQREEVKASYWKSKAVATNARYQAMDANRKFLAYNKYQSLNYQEYIEMQRYKDQKRDTVKVASAPLSKPKAKPHATIIPVDTSDNLSKMDDAHRQKEIQAALEEEERFKNYEEKTQVRKIDNADVTVRNIRIADDNYEMQIDKKGGTKYSKNGKPVTKITFEFETKRKMVDVLNTIREVDKFGK